MKMLSVTCQERKSRQRHHEVELLWHQLCDEEAFHQQEAEILRLQKLALEPELIALRYQFFVAT